MGRNLECTSCTLPIVQHWGRVPGGTASMTCRSEQHRGEFLHGMGFYSSTSKRIPHLIVLFIFWFTQTKTGTLYQRRGTRVRGCA